MSLSAHKTHGYCERHSTRPGKQTITPRVALCRRSIILFYLYILCILNNITIECIKRKKLTSIQRFGVRIYHIFIIFIFVVDTYFVTVVYSAVSISNELYIDTAIQKRHINAMSIFQRII